MSASPLRLGAVLVAVISCYIWPRAAGADAPRPTAREIATFLPLICDHPRPAATSGTQCAHLIGFPPLVGAGAAIAPPAPAPQLAGIFYGSFTRAGADQAYVTYYSDAVEGHVTNFGGGILFERAHGAWRLVRWYRGGQMDRGVPIPATKPLQLLCLSGYTAQGESDQTVRVQFVPPAGDALAAEPSLLEAHDTRAATFGDKNGCYDDVPKGQAALLGIGFSPTGHERTRSITTSAPPYFAQTQVEYETSADIAARCNGAHSRRVRVTRGTVRFALRSGRVVVIAPVTFYRPAD